MVDSKQDMLGAINNAVVDELKARNILASSDPADRSNDNITRHLTEHLQAVSNAKNFGDEGSKDTERKTLRDLTSITNNRREEANLQPVTEEKITEAVVSGWNKVVPQQHGQQQDLAKPADTWSEELLKRQQSLYTQR
ncbi:MAG: hypothetical protein AABY33_07840 [Pseudomonadota bacterium]